jgi:glutamyl-tRNA synthetase
LKESILVPAASRVRFAPAPSGSLHVGNARAALYNWLHARGTGGTFVLRVEDTDADRVTAEGMEAVFASLEFLGLEWDEGPRAGGDHGPYVQSERRVLHDTVVRRLLTRGHAYEAFETQDELQAQADAARRENRPPGYDGAHRDLTDAQREAFRAEGREPVVRLGTPDEGAATFSDVVRGEVTVEWARIPDFVIARADGSPTYYLANTVDDLAMGVTDVIRGEDLLSAVPRQMWLGRALIADGLLDDALAEVGIPARPENSGVTAYAHLPLLVGEDRKPLSKRHGSVAVEEFRRQGFLPEALVNLLALCGWSFDGQRERFDLDELDQAFSLDRVGRNPAAFDTDKLRAMNGDRIKEMAPGELATRLVRPLTEAGALSNPPTDADLDLLARLTPLVQERIQTLVEAEPLIAFAFSEQISFDEKAVKKWMKGRAGEVLQRAATVLGELEEWSGDAIMSALDAVSTELELGRGKTFQPVRVAVTGSSVSPPLPETLAELDRGEVVRRINQAADRFRPPVA